MHRKTPHTTLHTEASKTFFSWEARWDYRLTFFFCLSIISDFPEMNMNLFIILTGRNINHDRTLKL